MKICKTENCDAELTPRNRTGLCKFCYHKKWRKDNPKLRKNHDKSYLQSQKPGYWTVYGLYMPDSKKPFYIGKTEDSLPRRWNRHHMKPDYPNAIIKAIVKNIQTNEEARIKENEKIMEFDTIENGMNTYLNEI